MRATNRNATKSRRDFSSFDKKLIAYAVAGGAALVAPAHADSIVDYGGPTLTSTSNSSPINIAVDGVDFYFAGQTVTGNGVSGTLISNTWWSPSGVAKQGLGGLSGPLSPGQPVTGPFYTAVGSKGSAAGGLNGGVVRYKNVSPGTPSYTYSVNSVRGLVPNGVDTYLGLQLPVNGQTNYGWVLLDASLYGNSSAAFGEVQVLDYAYQSTPGAGILAGQTSETPEPSTLALFALGAVGVAAARRRAKRA